MSFVDSILQSAPAGTNPYAFAAEFVATIIPRKPDWYFANIIAAGVVGAINLMSTIACFFVMWKRSRAGTGVGLWFFRTRYGHSSGVPYIMPNALTMFLFWNLIFMLLMQPYIWLNYIAYYSPSLQLTSRMYFWYGFVFIWDATGMWTSAFGTLYATLLPKLFTVTPSENTTMRSILLHPITLNTFCFLPPFGLAITQIITSTYSAIAWSDLVYTQFGLIGILSTLATEWTVGVKEVKEDLVSQASDMGTLFLQQKDRSQSAFERNAWTCGSWYLLCIILFTPTAIWLLWVIRDAMKQRSRRVTPHVPPPTAALPSPQPTAFGEGVPRSNGFAPFSPLPSGGIRMPTTPATPATPGNLPSATWSASSRTMNAHHDDTTKPLRRALYTASLQFAATFFCLGVAAGSWLWIAADAGRLIVNPTLHALAILLTIWVYVVVGCFVNLFILIRTRRPDETPSSNAMPLSAIKASHASTSNSHNRTRSESDRKPVYIMAHTTTHVVVDDPHHRSSGSDNGVDLSSAGPYAVRGDELDVELDSSYSLNSAQFEGESPKGKALDEENGRWPR